MVRQENAEGFECTYGWDIIGDRHCVVEHRSSGGEHYRFRYDFANGQSEATDTFGNVARWQYNAREEVTAHTGFDGREYRFEYDRSGWPNVLHLPGSRRVRLEYDELGRLVSQTDPLGQTTRLDYHANTHHVRRAALDDGREWRTSYDTRHRPTGTVDPCGRRTVLQYADDGQLAQITDARGGPVVLEHDVRGLLTSRTDCSGQTTRYGYDADGRLEAVTNALGQTTRVSYAPDGLPESVTRADLQVEKYKWSALGHLVEHISPAGHIERWERDGLGRVLGFTDAQGRRVRYERDAHGRPLRLVNGNGASYRFEWDPVGRLIAEQRVDGTSRRMGYSESGFLQHIVSQGGASQREEIHERDALGRLLQREGEHSRTHYRYDRLGQLTEARRIPTTAGEMLDILADTVTLKYDETGRLLAEQGVHGSVRYERDVPGNPLSVVLPDGQRIDTLYYGSGHTHRIQVNGHAVADFERDNLHREIRRTQGDLVLHTGYTPMGQIAWQRASALPAGDEHAPSEAESALWWRYRYDSRGEMIESLDRLHGRTVYDYDRAGQLQMRSAEGFDVERFTWDAAGNLLDESTRTPDSRIPPLMDNLLRRYHGVRYAHDVWGQVIQRNGTTLQWDAEGHLLSTLTDQHRATYRYDALGRRTAKRVEQISMPGLMPGRQARETRFVWEGLRLAQERESSGDIRTYVYDPVRAYAPLARVDRSNGSSRDKVCYYHTDPAGTARQVTDSKGHVVWSGACTAWGKVRANLADAANFVQPLRLPGQYQDDESGLHYNLHRYYDPDSGRFISQDPIGLNGGFNLYQYAPNPISWIDPWGLSCESETSASASKFPSRNAAFKAAKRDAGIPMRQQPNRVDLVNLTDRSGKNILGENYQPIKTREYTFNREDGSQIVIQDHWPGHSYGPAGTSGNQGPHINVRPIEDTRNGTVPGTLEHYPF
ncbi:RHS repeat-associated core domain-containing protein [Paraburkholderia azotifigens]|nr:RHS repeat-associated core domain-containing protein [Paraburkholderia azotifigens]TXC80123.1 RHS repeat protein [Paraburkholderia azotifigens]